MTTLELNAVKVQFDDVISNLKGLIIVDGGEATPAWEALHPAYKEMFIHQDITVTPKGIGRCTSNMGSGCFGQPRALYTLTRPEILDLDGIADEPLGTIKYSYMCIECLIFELRRSICTVNRTSISAYTTGRASIHVPEYTEAFQFNTWFPEQGLDVDICPACNNYLLVNNEADGPRSIGYGYMTAWGNSADGDLWLAHLGCTFTCSTCEEPMLNRAWDSSVPAVRQYIVERESVCEDCFKNLDDLFECPQCDDYFLDENRRYLDAEGFDVCERCWDSYTIECDDCGEEYYHYNEHYCPDDDPEDHNLIHSYGYKPTPIFFPDTKQKYYLGMELEIECRDGIDEPTEIVHKALGIRAYMKADGSLEHGFEIVTHPMNLAEYQKMDWSFLTDLKRANARSWNTSSCGLHVHVSRTAFYNADGDNNYPHLVRFTKFIYDNQRQVERIAGRKNNHYATFNDKGRVIPKVKFGDQSNGRYSAVNLEPDETVEVRVFKGSLRKERVLSAIEFVTAVTEYTRQLPMIPKQNPFAWARFVHYVTEHSETYPNLFIIMNETFAKDQDPNDQESGE